jgi:uncharacterized protein with FMN-binding domain
VTRSFRRTRRGVSVVVGSVACVSLLVHAKTTKPAASPLAGHPTDALVQSTTTSAAQQRTRSVAKPLGPRVSPTLSPSALASPDNRRLSSHVQRSPVHQTPATHRQQQSVRPSATAQPASTPTPTQQTGTAYDGIVVQTQYGNVQVEVVVSGGHVSNVKALQLPGPEARSRQISAQAAPQLRQEAMQCQCSQIATVSGATATSDGYRKSLQSAMLQAGRT